MRKYGRLISRHPEYSIHPLGKPLVKKKKPSGAHEKKEARTIMSPIRLCSSPANPASTICSRRTHPHEPASSLYAPIPASRVRSSKLSRRRSTIRQTMINHSLHSRKNGSLNESVNLGSVIDLWLTALYSSTPSMLRCHRRWTKKIRMEFSSSVSGPPSNGASVLIRSTQRTATHVGHTGTTLVEPSRTSTWELSRGLSSITQAPVCRWERIQART